MTTPDQQRRINVLNTQTNMLPEAAEVWAKYDDRRDLSEAEADEVIEALEQVAYPLTEWLVERCGCHDTYPVKVKIGRETFEGAHYAQTLPRESLPLSLVDTREPSHERYVRHALYLMGELPASYRRSRKTIYEFDLTDAAPFRGIGPEWYVASWATKDIATSEQYGRYHYGNGPHFLLFPHNVPGFDDAEPYKRVEAKLLR